MHVKYEPQFLIIIFSQHRITHHVIVKVSKCFSQVLPTFFTLAKFANWCHPSKNLILSSTVEKESESTKLILILKIH